MPAWLIFKQVQLDDREMSSLVTSCTRSCRMITAASLTAAVAQLVVLVGPGVASHRTRRPSEHSRRCAGASTAFFALFSLLVFCGPSGMVPFNGGSTGTVPQYAALPAGNGALARHGRVLTSFEPTDTNHDAAVALVQGQLVLSDHSLQLGGRFCPIPSIMQSDREHCRH